MGLTCQTCTTSANKNLTQIQINFTHQYFICEIQKHVHQLRQENKQSIQQSKIYQQQNDKIYIGKKDRLQKTGYGQYYNTNMNTIVLGNFQGNLLNGQGIIIYGNNFIKADFSRGVPSGQVYEKVNRNYFHGLFDHGSKIKGILTTDQYRYQGAFKENKYNGYGILQFQNGDRYEGQFMNGLYHGDGSYFSRQNGKYTGQWKYGLYDGKGKFIWENGDYYQGQYKEGSRNGFGKMIRDGQILQGIWENAQLRNYQILSQKKTNFSSNLGQNVQKQYHSLGTSSTSHGLAGYTIQLLS